MITTLKPQRGMSMISMMFLLFVLAMFVLVFLKLFPSYMTNMTVESVLNGVVDEARQGGGADSIGELRKTILTRFNFNSVEKLGAEDVVIKQLSHAYEVKVDYVDQIHLTGNIDVLLTFENHVEVPR